MEIKKIGIIGNCLTSKILALLIKKNNDVDVKIFTNGEAYTHGIISPIQLPKNPNFSFLQLLNQVGINPTDLFTRTDSTLSPGVSFSGLQEDNIVLPIKCSPVKIEYINHDCQRKNFLKYNNIASQYYAFMEWCIQTNHDLLDMLTFFPFDLYKQNNQQDFYFNFDLDLIPTTFNILELPSFMAGCFDLHSINEMLLELVNNHNIEIVTEAIDNVIDYTFDVDPATIQVNEGNCKLKKIIQEIQINAENYPVDLVINTGTTLNYFVNFIETPTDSTETLPYITTVDDDDIVTVYDDPQVHCNEPGCWCNSKPIPLYENNETIVFTNVTSELIDFEPTSLFKNQITETSFIKYLHYTNKTVKLEFNNDASTISNKRKNYLTNSKYDSNYIEFDLNSLRPNPLFDEEITALVEFAYLINTTVSSIVIDVDNMYNYINNIDFSWNNHKRYCKIFAYHFFKNNSLTAFDTLKTTPPSYNLNFGSKIPTLLDENSQGVEIEKDKSLPSENFFADDNSKNALVPYEITDYQLVSLQKKEITDFVSTFEENDETFLETYYLSSKLIKAHFYARGFLTFEEYKNLVLLNKKNFISDSQFELDDGTVIVSGIKYLPVKLFDMVRHDL